MSTHNFPRDMYPVVDTSPVDLDAFKSDGSSEQIRALQAGRTIQFSSVRKLQAADSEDYGLESEE